MRSSAVGMIQAVSSAKQIARIWLGRSEANDFGRAISRSVRRPVEKFG